MKRQQVPGIPNLFAYEDGRIYDSNKGRFRKLSPLSKKRKYLRVTHDKHPYLVHRLILCAFTNKPINYYLEAMHIDGNCLNNNIHNLKWGTHSENMFMDRGNKHSFKGEINKNSKICIRNVTEIRNAYKNKKSFRWGRKILAEKLKISETQVLRIAKSLKGGWSHVQ